MTGGRASRDKGNRAEREAVNLLQEAGLSATRVPLSGAAGNRYSADIDVSILGEDKKFEVKCRASGFKQIYEWLKPVDGLVIRADREAPLIVIRLKDFAALAIRADEARFWEHSSHAMNRWAEELKDALERSEQLATLHVRREA